MTAYQRGSFDYPVARFLFFETAFVTDIIVHLAPLIFPCGNAVYFFSAIPDGYFSGTFGAVAVCVLWFQKPDTVLEPECFVSECPYRANVDHISDKITFQCLMDIGRYFGMIATVQDSMFPFLCELISHKHTAE